MSSILYYSNFCEHSKKLLQTLSKTQVSKDIHFICIDKRVKDQAGKIQIILENGQKIVMPENVTKVPALLLLNQNYQVLYGDNIYNHLKPRQEVVTRQATSNNMEPMAFSLGGGGGFGGIVSDNYSFLDMDHEELNTKGSGGMRQMHNYVPLNHSDLISTPKDDFDYKKEKISGDLTVEQLQKQREQELSNYGPQQQQRKI
uniref:Glutaredoxin domain-containing protein n=1 Tax=viral metagenome TaxID=1070528 RepID=A0A6C0DG28_9ZZZZ